jgi:uncharacterized protein YndB with AHSA1/START domain
MSADQALRVTTPGDREIVLAREFDAPPSLVFEAMTTPHLLTRWYGARGWNLVTCEVDLRAGGSWRFVSRGPDGTEMVQSGVYQEIVRPERLVFTEVFDDQSYPGEALIAHVLTERAATTTLTSTVHYPSRKARDIVLRYPMAHGVGQAYDRLDDVLAGLAHLRVRETHP